MILNFLQTRDPPIIPSLHKEPHRLTPDSEFADDLSKVKGFGKENKESLGQLLFHFFRRYGHEIDYEKSVVSVREGRLLTRNEKNWHLAGLTKEARNRLCVEEPFNTERNLGNSADDFAWRGIHLEIRRAFDLLADGGQLEKACEQYEYPPEEKFTFKKPTSTKPTLTSSAPSNRGGRGGSRGGRGNFNQKGNHAYGGRRSSSGASSFGQNRPPFLNSPPMQTAPGQEYFSRGLNEQLHDQLYQQYQILEMQSNSLRAQLAAQQRAQQAQHAQAAHMHAQAVAHAQAQAQNRGPSSTNGSPQKSPYVNGGRSSPRLSELGIPPNAFPHGFLYQYPGFFDPTQGSVPGSQDGARTNPSSPSLSNSIPGLRRGMHRSSNASDTAASIRSQSQPPRGGQLQPSLQGYPPIPQYFDPSSFAGYPIARSTQEVPTSQPTAEVPFSPLSGHPEPVVPDTSEPKEYVGYYVAEPPQGRLQLQDYAVPQIPSYNELAQRRRRVSPEITQPLLNTAMRRVSRSPSPLGGHMRSYSTGIAPGPVPNTQQRKDRIDSTHPQEDSGPVIVNGSFPAQSRESRNRSDSVDVPSAPTNMINPAALGIYVNNVDQHKFAEIEQRQQLVLDEMRRQKAMELMRAGMINGSINKPQPIDTNGLIRVRSGDKQPFPVPAEAWMGYNSMNGNGDKSNRSTEVSPTRTLPPQFRPISQFTNGLGLRAIDTMNAPRESPQETQSAGVGPLLSPVQEARTPSPSANRQSDVHKLVNGIKSQSKENNQQQRRASHSAAQSSGPKENHHRGNQQKGNAHNNEKGNKPNTGTGTHNASSNGNGTGNNWSQPQKGRRKKPQKSKQGVESKPSGEPLPANAADRKGG
jgi:hypothetical protein